MTKAAKRFRARQAGVFAAGIVVYAFGTALMARANIGVAPISSVAFLAATLFPISLGVGQLLLNVSLVAIQILMLRREFGRLQYLQLPAALLFSFFIDFSMPLAAQLDPVMASLPGRCMVFLLSLLLMAAGLGTVVTADVVILPGDGVARTLALKLNWPFGKAKVLNDCIFVSLTCIVSLLALHRVVGVQVGTVTAALTLGHLARLYMRLAGPWLRRLMRESEAPSAVPAEPGSAGEAEG